MLLLNSVRYWVNAVRYVKTNGWKWRVGTCGSFWPNTCVFANMHLSGMETCGLQNLWLGLIYCWWQGPSTWVACWLYEFTSYKCIIALANAAFPVLANLHQPHVSQFGNETRNYEPIETAAHGPCHMIPRKNTTNLISLLVCRGHIVAFRLAIYATIHPMKVKCASTWKGCMSKTEMNWVESSFSYVKSQIDTFQSSWQFHSLLQTYFPHFWTDELQPFRISAVDVIHWESGLRLCKKSSKIFKSVTAFAVGVLSMCFLWVWCGANGGMSPRWCCTGCRNTRLHKVCCS